MTGAAAADTDLCTQCGLCCSGALFDFGPLDPAEVEAARSNGLAVLEAEGRYGFAQPCPALDGAWCRAYAQRPQTCREFRCKLLRSVEAGDITLTEAESIITRTLMARDDALAQLPPGATFIDARRWRREAGAAGPAATLNSSPMLMIALGLLDIQLDQHFRKASDRQIMARE
jgi:uncharacterized protein